MTTRVVKTLSSARKRIKTPGRGKGSMADLLEGASTIRTSVSSDIFDAKTDVAYSQKEFIDENGENGGSSAVT